MQKFQIIGFLFGNGLHWQFEVGKNSTNGSFRLHIYLLINTTLIHNSLYVFDSWGEYLSRKKELYRYSKKMFTRRVPDNWRSG
jgi:hypothetical protein